VRADRTAMSLALSNLIDNAIRYSAQSRHLSISASQNGSALVIEVADKGIGIAAVDLPYLTRKFFRGRGAEKQTGSGLGLAIVQRIVSDHGGSLAFRSVVGEGTTVSVTLPITEATA